MKFLKGCVSDYVNEVTRFRYYLNFTKFIIIILITAIIVLIYTNISTISAQKTIIIPVGMYEKVEVGDTYATASYLKSMGNYVATLLYNFNSNTVAGQYEELATMMTSSSRTDAARQAAEYHKNNVSSRIIVQEIRATDKQIIVSMLRTKYILDKPQIEQKVTLNISYFLEYGMFKIKTLEVEDEN